MVASQVPEWRTSVMRPVSAAAAAIAGLTRWVRLPVPWRSTVLRFDVEAQRLPGATLSPFMATHIEQPDSPQLKPASRNTRSSPSASATSFTCVEPGTTSAGITAWRPRMTLAAERRSSMRALVQDIARTEAEAQSTERTVRRGVGVAAHQDHAGLGDALLGPDHVHDALPRIVQREVDDAELAGIARQQFNHAALVGVGDRRDVVAAARHPVVGRGEHLVGMPDTQAACLQELEGVGGAVVGDVARNVQQRLAVVTLQDRVRVPDFFVEGLAHEVLRSRLLPASCN
jgi:hypothetical protein